MEVLVETFDTIHSLLNALNSRKNNKAMKGENSSSDNGYDFTKTHSMEEANELLHFGYSDVIADIKSQLRKNSYKQKSHAKHPKQVNGIAGFIPNVPNAILGRVDSMINIEKVLLKKKTLSVVYLIGANCNKDVDYFVKAGTALISAIQSIEKRGVQVKLQECFFSANGSSQRTYALLNLKNYGHRFDLKKITFPIAHPSMFRRFGFKWLETYPKLTDSSYAWGYGCAIHNHDIEQEDLSKYITKDTIAINVYQIEDMGFDVEKIIKYLNKDV